MVFIGNAVVPGSPPPASGSGGGGNFSLIQTITVAANGDNVDFTSIPATFKHLFLIGSLIDNGAGGPFSLTLNFNGDVASDYKFWLTQTFTSSTFPQNGTGGYINAGNIAGRGDANFPDSATAFSIWIPDYTSTSRWKMAQGISTAYNIGSIFGGAWDVMPVAINEVTLNDSSGHGFVAGGVASLYGLTG